MATPIDTTPESSSSDLDIETGWFGENRSTADKLQHCILLQARTDLEKELRRGPYAVEHEITYKGLRCVGKRIISKEENDSEFAGRFEKLCSILSEIRHPHIVQFMGVSSSISCPLIVTEFLPIVLADALQKYGSEFPESLSYGVLHDTSLALCYLHERVPAITHRGLSAGSVLLTRDVRAKLADVGMMDVLNLSPLQMLQKSRSVFAYMAPEAVHAQIEAQYRMRIDAFSYGVLVLHVFTGNLPMPSDVVSDSQPERDKPAAGSEAELRKGHLQQLGEHPLRELVLQCLNNDPRNRPEASTILKKVASCACAREDRQGDRIEMMSQIAAILKDKQSLSTEVQELKASLSLKEEEVKREKLQLQRHELAYSVGSEHTNIKIRELEAKNKQLKATVKVKEDEAQKKAETDRRLRLQLEERCARRIEENDKRLKAKLEKQRQEHEAHFEEAKKKDLDRAAARQKEFDSGLKRFEQILNSQLQQKVKEAQETQQKLQALLDAKEHELKALLDAKKHELKEKETQLAWICDKQEAAKMKREEEYKSHLKRKEDEYLYQSQLEERKSKTRVKEMDELLKEKDRELQSQREASDQLLASELDKKDQELKKKESEIGAKDALLQQKTTVLQELHQQLDHLHSTMMAKSLVHPLNMHATLTWKGRAPLPTAMAHPQVVVIDGEVYAGGGETESDETNCQLFKYTPFQDKWADPYVCPVRYFGLGELEGKPVLVGGVSTLTKEVTGDMHVLDGKKFTSTNFPMPTARSHLCVASHESLLIACGGCKGKFLLASVEILKKDTQEWLKGGLLSIPFARMLSATVGDFCFLMGGVKPSGKLKGTPSTRTVLCTSLTALLKEAVPMADPDPKSTAWKPFRETQYKYSAPVAMGELLLAVGGDSMDIVTTTPAKDIKQAVYAFCPSNKSWAHIVDLPAPCTMATAVALPSQEILVIGGKDSSLKFSRAVHRGTLRTE